MANFHGGKIILLDSPKCDLDAYRNSMGELAICLPDGLEYQVVKTKDELTDLDKLTSDYSSTFDLNIDHKTRILLGNIQYRIVKGVSIFRAILLDGDMVVLDGFLRISSTIEAMLYNTVTYSIQIIGTHQTWKEPMKNLCFTDLDLGTLLWDKNVLTNLMQNNQSYTDGGVTVYPMLADFGKFYEEKYFNKNNVTIYDLRFVVYLLPIIKQMFGLLGYCVKSIFLESVYFRKEAIYALRPNFYDIDNDGGDNLRTDAKAELSTDILVAPPVSNPLYKVPFDNVLINNTGKYNNTTYKYTNNTAHILDVVFVRLDMTVCNYGNTDDITFAVWVTMKNQFNTTVFSYLVPELNINPPNGTLPLNACVSYQGTLDWSQILRDGLYNTGFIPIGYSLEINLSYGFEQPTILQGSSVEYLFGGNHWYEGDIIPISQVLTCNATLYDYLLDWKNMYNLRFRTDEANKTVTIEPQPSRYLAYESFKNNTLYPAAYVKGFESGTQDPNEVWDITDLIDVCQEINKDFEPNSEFNSIKFKFKDSTDLHPSYDPYKILGNELWSKLITLDNANVLNTLEIALNQIEPTLNDFVPRISASQTSPIYIPIMWDATPDAGGEVPESGSAYETRIFHVFGNLFQMADNPAGGLLSRLWKFEGLTTQRVPTIAQTLPPNMYVQQSFTPFLLEINNIFGDNVYSFFNKDLVTTFYPEAIAQLKEGVELSLEIRLNTLTFVCQDISQMVRIFSENVPLIQLNNHYTISKIIKSFGVDKHATIILVPKLSCDT